MILQDGGLSFVETSDRLKGVSYLLNRFIYIILMRPGQFFEHACRTDTDTFKGHLLAYAWYVNIDVIYSKDTDMMIF